ncbi:methionine permease [Leucoagaricus gongylophorus]
MVAVTGLVALKNGIPTVASIQQEEYQWRGRQNFVGIWKGTSVSPSSPCLCLYSVRLL